MIQARRVLELLVIDVKVEVVHSNIIRVRRVDINALVFLRKCDKARQCLQLCSV